MYTVEALEIAKKFHETYERLAPSFGYETRTDTKAFDPTTPNGQLMTMVCGQIANQIADEAFRAGYEQGRLESPSSRRR